MNNLDRIKYLRAQDYGVAGLSTTDVDWLIAEVERLTAERDRYKAWHDDACAELREVVSWSRRDRWSEELWQEQRSRCCELLERILPQPLKENE